MTEKNYARVALCLVAAIGFILSLAVWSCFNAVPVPSHFAPMVIPGPTIVVERQTYRERIPGANGRPIETGFLNDVKIRPARSKCDAECRAYRKAYANARLANKLLGEHRYKEHA